MLERHDAESHEQDGRAGACRSDARAGGPRATPTPPLHGGPQAAVLSEVETAAEPGQLGAILRERLYSSHLVEWRRARDRGALEASNLLCSLTPLTARVGVGSHGRIPTGPCLSA